MILYVLRERWGSLSTSPRKPRPVTQGDLDEAAGHYAALPGWLMIPDEVFMKGGPSLEIVMEWAFSAHMLAQTIFGHRLAAINAFVNSYIKKQAARYLLASQIGYILGYVVPTAVVLAWVWLINPVAVDFVCDEVFPWRYIGAYEEKMWWMDIAGISANGQGVYVVCKEIPGLRMFAFRNEYFRGHVADRWEFGDSWVDEKDEFFNYQRWVWSSGWAEFIGVMTRVGAREYELVEPFVDPYLADITWPYLKPAGDVCRRELEVP